MCIEKYKNRSIRYVCFYESWPGHDIPFPLQYIALRIYPVNVHIHIRKDIGDTITLKNNPSAYKIAVVK